MHYAYTVLQLFGPGPFQPSKYSYVHILPARDLSIGGSQMWLEPTGNFTLRFGDAYAEVGGYKCLLEADGQKVHMPAAPPREFQLNKQASDAIKVSLAARPRQYLIESVFPSMSEWVLSTKCRNQGPQMHGWLTYKNAV